MQDPRKRSDKVAAAAGETVTSLVFFLEVRGCGGESRPQSRGHPVSNETFPSILQSAGTEGLGKRRVEVWFFGGLSVEDAAEVLEISEETATRDWRVAKTWLFREVGRIKDTS
jgi:hypothetical protein